MEMLKALSSRLNVPHVVVSAKKQTFEEWLAEIPEPTKSVKKRAQDMIKAALSNMMGYGDPLRLKALKHSAKQLEELLKHYYKSGTEPFVQGQKTENEHLQELKEYRELVGTEITKIKAKK